MHCILLNMLQGTCILDCFYIDGATNYVTTNMAMSFVMTDLDFLFHMFFLARYCKLLEENSFRGRTADFLYMLLFGATFLTGTVLVGGMIPYLSESFAKMIFLSNSLTLMMVSFH